MIIDTVDEFTKANAKLRNDKFCVKVIEPSDTWLKMIYDSELNCDGEVPRVAISTSTKVITDFIEAVKTGINVTRVVAENIMEKASVSGKGRPRQLAGVKDDEWKVVTTGTASHYRCAAVGCNLSFTTLQICKAHVAANHPKPKKSETRTEAKKVLAAAPAAQNPAKRQATESSENLCDAEEVDEESCNLMYDQEYLGEGINYEFNTQENFNPAEALDKVVDQANGQLKQVKKKSKKQKKYSSEVAEGQRTLRGLFKEMEELEGKCGKNRSYIDTDGINQVTGAEGAPSNTDEELLTGSEARKYTCNTCSQNGLSS